MTPNDIIITDAAHSDVPEIFKIELSSFTDPWTEEMLRSQIRGEGKLFLTARHNNNAVGYVGLTHVLDEGCISKLAVLQDFRRQGIGSLLIDAAKARAGALGLSFITLETRESNSASRGLYLRHDFIVAGQRKDYYENPREDAVLMTCFMKPGEIKTQ